MDEAGADLVTGLVIEAITEERVQVGADLVLEREFHHRLVDEAREREQRVLGIGRLALELVRVIRKALLIGLPVTRSVCGSICHSPDQTPTF